MTTYRFWTHEESGDIYAIAFSTATGDVTGVCGPIHYSERKTPLSDFEYETEDVDWVVAHNGAFRDTTTAEEWANR